MGSTHTHTPQWSDRNILLVKTFCVAARDKLYADGARRSEEGERRRKSDWRERRKMMAGGGVGRRGTEEEWIVREGLIHLFKA